VNTLTTAIGDTSDFLDVAVDHVAGVVGGDLAWSGLAVRFACYGVEMTQPVEAVGLEV